MVDLNKSSSSNEDFVLKIKTFQIEAPKEKFICFHALLVDPQRSSLMEKE
jgi:hypothetical protein